MPVCIHTICFKEWGRECAMHFRPRCVCRLFTRFVWEDCAWVVDFVGGIVRKCITEFGRGGACVPTRVALQGRIHS